MAYTPSTPELGIQPIGANSTTQNHAEGTVIDAYDDTLGGGKFVYLKGVAGTVVGSIVQYDQVNHTTTLAPITTKNLNVPLAVAMSANVALQWGWYQVEGAAVIKKTAVTVLASVPLYLSGTAGRVMSTAASGREVMNCVSVNAATVAAATSTITAQIAYPFAQGAVT